VDAGRLNVLQMGASASTGEGVGPWRAIDLRPEALGRPSTGTHRVALAVQDRWGDEGVIADFLFAVRGSDGAVLVHDADRRDAAALLVAVYRVILQNWRVDRALAEMKRSGVRFTEVARRQILQWLHRLRRRREAWLRATDPEKVLVRAAGPGRDPGTPNPAPAPGRPGATSPAFARARRSRWLARPPFVGKLNPGFGAWHRLLGIRRFGSDSIASGKLRA
jgi:hypothetical protein